VRYTLPQRATRHALIEEGAHALAGSSPVRRGIAVAAVVGGALSVAGAAVAVDQIPFPRDTTPDDLAIGLAADDSDDADDGDGGDGDGDSGSDSTAESQVLDTSALAETVREANEEGKRLAEEQESDDDADSDDDSETAPAAAAPAAGSGRTASKFPAELIDTNEWYLTLPTGKEGRPDTVEGSELANYHSKFFELTQARDGIVFTANAGGATTSGSHYPRSELREMNGEEKASWDGRKGTHVMELDQAITKTPDAKPDVIAGQIHGTSDDLMQIHLSGKDLTVKYADGKKKVSLDDNYQLGTRFKVKIESSGGHVKVWYNGQQRADLPISTSTSYFKAGAYVNSNTSKGEKSAAEGQVVIYNVDVKHT
jgi:Alginate lyase